MTTEQHDAGPGSARSVRDRAEHVVERQRALGGRGLLLPALHAVQAEFGHVPGEAVAVLADAFNLSRADVHGVLTFYPDFRKEPGGRVAVRLCRAEACQAVGAQALIDAVEARLGTRLGSATADGAVQLDEVFCLGNCALGPSASVAGRVIGRATTDRVLQAVQRAVDEAPSAPSAPSGASGAAS
jgi:formate dehydrogenase subunit gamma